MPESKGFFGRTPLKLIGPSEEGMDEITPAEVVRETGRATVKTAGTIAGGWSDLIAESAKQLPSNLGRESLYADYLEQQKVSPDTALANMTETVIGAQPDPDSYLKALEWSDNRFPAYLESLGVSPIIASVATPSAPLSFLKVPKTMSLLKTAATVGKEATAAEKIAAGLKAATEAERLAARSALASAPEAVQAEVRAAAAQPTSSIRRKYAGVKPTEQVPETGSSLRNRYKDVKPTTTQVGESLSNRFTPNAPVAPANTGPSLRNKYQPGKVAEAPQAENVITGESPAPMPLPAPEPIPAASPVITPAQAAPAPSPVATPTAAQETAGLEAAKPGFWSRQKLELTANPVDFVRKNPKASLAGAAGAAELAHLAGKGSQMEADQAAMDRTLANAGANKPPAAAPPPAPSQGEPPPPAAGVAGVNAPSEEDIYDEERASMQTTGIQNLNDAANSVATAREASIDPEVEKRKADTQAAIAAVNEMAGQKMPEREWNEKLGLILAGIGGGLRGDPDAPIRLSETLRQGQRQKISDLQSGAEQRLKASQAGLDATLAGSRERMQRGDQRVGDVARIAGLRQEAAELALKAQAERDPRKRAQMKAQIELINSEIAKNRSSSDYYQSGARVQNMMAKTEGQNLDNELKRVGVDYAKEKLKKSPNRPSAKE